MNELLQIHLFLAEALSRDSLNALAVLTVLLDPLWIGVADPDELDPRYHDYEEGDDPKYHALLILRRCFPELYVEAVAHLHRGISASDMETFLCEGFSKVGIPMDDGSLESIWWGIPLPSYGHNLDEADFHSSFPETLNILALFGIVLDEEGEIHLPDMEAASDLAICLRQSLEAHIEKHEKLRQIFFAIGWLWGISRNSCVDMNNEEMMEIQPLDWNEQDIEFARHMIKEAHEIMDDALAGIEYLNEDAPAFALLQANLDSLENAYLSTFKKGENPSYEQLRHLTKQCQLDWSALAGSPL
jgi:hypothetical protein